MLEGAGEALALRRIVAQPVQQFCESPLGRVHAAATGDRWKVRRTRRGGDLGGFFGRAMVAPEIVLIQRHQLLVDWNHCRAGGVERDREHVGAVDVRVGERAMRGNRQSVHVRRVRLRREIRIMAIAMHGIFGHTGSDRPAFAVDNRHTNALRSEIDSGDDWHQARAASPRAHEDAARLTGRAVATISVAIRWAASFRPVFDASL